jgi:hypothetical protein
MSVIEELPLKRSNKVVDVYTKQIYVFNYVMGLPEKRNFLPPPLFPFWLL